MMWRSLNRLNKAKKGKNGSGKQEWERPTGDQSVTHHCTGTDI
jgi:hypothetical protein